MQSGISTENFFSFLFCFFFFFFFQTMAYGISGARDQTHACLGCNLSCCSDTIRSLICVTTAGTPETSIFIRGWLGSIFFFSSFHFHGWNLHPRKPQAFLQPLPWVHLSATPAPLTGMRHNPLQMSQDDMRDTGSCLGRSTGVRLGMGDLFYNECHWASGALSAPMASLLHFSSSFMPFLVGRRVDYCAHWKHFLCESFRTFL